MKKIKALFIVLAAASVLTSCEDYFTVDLKDQANMDEVFSESTTTKRYLSHLYSYLPLDEEVVGSDGWVVARSDEAMFSWYQWVYYLGYRTGNYGSATGSKSDSGTSFNYWKKFYVAIRQCTTFMDYVDKDVKDSEEIRAAMKAEARFLRAFYYFCLFRQYGPVIVWGDQLAPEDVDGASLDRNTVDENINFIVTELDKAIADLPMNIEDIGESVQKWQGRATKGAAMALKSRVLLFAASPLYNGCELYKGQMKNKDGNYLFPQQADPEKWEKAAQAALDVINLNKYNLCKVVKTGDAFKDGAASYQSVFFEPWNEETIFGWWRRTSDSYSWLYGGAPLACACPPNMEGIYQGYGGIAPSLRLVDTYPMWESGRYPVKGYQKDGVYNNYSRPIIDEESGYVNEPKPAYKVNFIDTVSQVSMGSYWVKEGDKVTLLEENGNYNYTYTDSLVGGNAVTAETTISADTTIYVTKTAKPKVTITVDGVERDIDHGTTLALAGLEGTYACLETKSIVDLGNTTVTDSITLMKVDLETEVKDGKTWFKISSADELDKFAKLVTDYGITDINGCLTDDIDSYNGTMIGSNVLEEYKYVTEFKNRNFFIGSFDGDGHTVYFENNSGNTGTFAGLFGSVSAGAEIKNVITAGTVVGNARFTGALVASVICQKGDAVKIDNCINRAEVDTQSSESKYIGGLVGEGPCGIRRQSI